jgi:hypothetical protein
MKLHVVGIAFPQDSPPDASPATPAPPVNRPQDNPSQPEEQAPPSCVGGVYLCGNK